MRKVGIQLPNTAFERALVILSRYKEASIAVVALVLAIYFQVGSNGQFLSSQELSVVLRDTGRFGLIAVAEVMLMITGEIDLSVGSTFSLAPYVMVLMTIGLGRSARRQCHRRRAQRHHYSQIPRAFTDHDGRHVFPASRCGRVDLQ